MCYVFALCLEHLLHSWRMSCWLLCGLISLLSLCMSSCFWNYFTLCENLSHSLFFDCVIYASWMLAQWPWLDSFWMLFWFTCMLGYDLGNFVLWAYSQMSLPWTIFVDTPFWACIPFHCSIAHYKPLAWKTMIIPTLGNFGALELFWEWVLN